MSCVKHAASKGYTCIIHSDAWQPAVFRWYFQGELPALSFSPAAVCLLNQSPTTNYMGVVGWDEALHILKEALCLKVANHFGRHSYWLVGLRLITHRESLTLTDPAGGAPLLPQQFTTMQSNVCVLLMCAQIILIFAVLCQQTAC